MHAMVLYPGPVVCYGPSLEIMPIVLPIVLAYRFKNDRQTIGSAYRFTKLKSPYRSLSFYLSFR
jgi:hypothetical protein